MRDFNFFAPYQGQKKQTVNKKIYIYSIGVILLLIVVGTLIWNSVRIHMLNSSITKYNKEINSSQVQEKVKIAEDINRKITILNKYDAGLTELADGMESNNNIKSEFLNDLNLTLPQDVSLKSASIDGSSINIQGASKSRTAIGEFQHNIKALDKIEDAQIGSISSDGTNGAEYSFDLKCTLKDVDKNENK